MKSINVLITGILALCLLSGCHKQIEVKTNDTTGEVTLTIPADATAAELIQARGIADASATLRGERERMYFEFQQAKLRKAERQFYAVLIVGGVVTGIVSIFAVACGVMVWKFGGLHK